MYAATVLVFIQNLAKLLGFLQSYTRLPNTRNSANALLSGTLLSGTIYRLWNILNSKHANPGMSEGSRPVPEGSGDGL